MSHLSQPPSGQRWRSLVDGHMVVTLDHDGEKIFVRFEDAPVVIALETAEFVEDYAFVDWCPPRPTRLEAARSSG